MAECVLEAAEARAKLVRRQSRGDENVSSVMGEIVPVRIDKRGEPCLVGDVGR